MAIRRPTGIQIQSLAETLGMSLTAGESEAFVRMLEGTFDAYDRVDAMPDHLPEVTYPRVPGRRPEAADNPHNAWAVKTSIKGAPTGPLVGRTVAINDNICIAGVPMAMGAGYLEGYVPDVDATVVTRILEAGGEIVGKATCEYLCLSGGSHTSWPAPVLNPHDPSRMAGGSSSGAAVLVASGEAEMALGGDQGGSIRIPAAWCGIVGLKPTYGLVPFTGIFPVELTVDHVGPMTRTVRDNALLLEVLAGADGIDPRQYAPNVTPYLETIEDGVRGLRIGVVAEGFGTPEAEQDVDRLVREQAELFASLGAAVEEVSVPVHAVGRAIWTPTLVEGLVDLMMRNNGTGTNQRGLFINSMADAHGRWRQHADEFSVSLKVVLLAAEFIRRQYGSRFYGKSQNLMRRMRDEYDQVFERYDLLLMPTTPQKPTHLPPPSASPEEIYSVALNMNRNTSPFCGTGHPSITVPCGTIDGLPIGLMLTARHHEEAVLFRASYAFESEADV